MYVSEGTLGLRERGRGKIAMIFMMMEGWLVVQGHSCMWRKTHSDDTIGTIIPVFRFFFVFGVAFPLFFFL